MSHLPSTDLGHSSQDLSSTSPSLNPQYQALLSDLPTASSHHAQPNTYELQPVSQTDEEAFKAFMIEEWKRTLSKHGKTGDQVLRHIEDNSAIINSPSLTLNPPPSYSTNYQASDQVPSSMPVIQHSTSSSPDPLKLHSLSASSHATNQTFPGPGQQNTPDVKIQWPENLSLTAIVSCQLCHNRFDLPPSAFTPKGLPCQHTFCVVCLATRAAATPKGNMIPCPQCNIPTLVPRESLTRLFGRVK